MDIRFPLSVERYFIFRSRIDDTGEYLYCEEFKELYYRTRTLLRAAVDDGVNTYYPVMAHLEYGYCVRYEMAPNYFYEEWHPVVDHGYMFCSKFYETYTRNDNTELVIERAR